MDPPDPRDTTREIEKAARPRDLTAERKLEAKAVEQAAVRAAPEIARKPIETRTIVAGGAATVAPVKAITPALEPPLRGAAQTPPAVLATPASVPSATPSAIVATARLESTVVAAPPPGAADRDIVEGRLSAARDWLAAAPQTTHTIQIMGASNEQQLRSHIKSLSSVLDPNRIFVFRTVAQGKPATTVVYGAYADRESALRALAKLPASLTVNRPVLRTVNGIREEMK